MRAAALLALATIGLAFSGEPAAGKGQWVPISDGVVEQLAKEGKKIPWPGLTAGLIVDRPSGDVCIFISGQGIWRSTDVGKTFERLDGGKIGGRCETSYSVDYDLNGKRMACFMLDGAAAMTLDGGKTWENCQDKSRGFDNAVVDWSQPEPKTIFGVRHEAGGLLLISQDGGKNYKQLGKNYKCVGVFDEKTLVVTRDKDALAKASKQLQANPADAALKELVEKLTSEPGILRSTDGGETWTKVSDLSPSGLSVRVFNGVGYWTSAGGLLVSKDKGATWAVQGAAIAAGAGPYFGKDEKQIIVATKDGLSESTDGGQTWKLAAPVPPGPDFKFSPNGWFVNFGWDHIHDVFYISRMGKPAYKFER